MFYTIFLENNIHKKPHFQKWIRNLLFNSKRSNFVYQISLLLTGHNDSITNASSASECASVCRGAEQYQLSQHHVPHGVLHFQGKSIPTGCGRLENWHNINSWLLLSPHFLSLHQKTTEVSAFWFNRLWASWFLCRDGEVPALASSLRSCRFCQGSHLQEMPSHPATARNGTHTRVDKPAVAAAELGACLSQGHSCIFMFCHGTSLLCSLPIHPSHAFTHRDLN